VKTLTDPAPLQHAAPSLFMPFHVRRQAARRRRKRRTFLRLSRRERVLRAQLAAVVASS